MFRIVFWDVLPCSTRRREDLKSHEAMRRYIIKSFLYNYLENSKSYKIVHPCSKDFCSNMSHSQDGCRNAHRS
jgi:hypothetical protein